MNTGKLSKLDDAFSYWYTATLLIFALFSQEKAWSYEITKDRSRCLVDYATKSTASCDALGNSHTGQQIWGRVVPNAQPASVSLPDQLQIVPGLTSFIHLSTSSFWASFSSSLSSSLSAWSSLITPILSPMTNS